MEPPSSRSWSCLVHGAPRRAMTSVSVSNHSGSVSTSRPSMSNSTASSTSVTSYSPNPAITCVEGPLRGLSYDGPRASRVVPRLDAEVAGGGVVDDDGVGGLLRVQLHLLRKLDADALG